MKNSAEKNFVNFYDHYWSSKESIVQSGDPVIEKINIISENIPNDVTSIADIGCGNGTITNVLTEKYYTIGADISLTGLKLLSPKAKAILCSAEHLPIHNEAVDLAFSSELLEHLPNEAFKQALNEIKRISKKYIVISVPNMEQLRSRFVKCYDCEKEQHIYSHFRSFSKKTLQEFFPEYDVIYTTCCGVPEEHSNYTLSYLRNTIGGSYFRLKEKIEWRCIYCGSIITYKKRNIIQLCINILLIILQKILNLILRKKPHLDWLIMIFKRNDKLGSTSQDDS